MVMTDQGMAEAIDNWPDFETKHTVKTTEVVCTVTVNDRAYKFGPNTKTRQVTFEIALDMVEGWGHQLEDHIQLFFMHDAYVLSARVED